MARWASRAGGTVFVELHVLHVALFARKTAGGLCVPERMTKMTLSVENSGSGARWKNVASTDWYLREVEVGDAQE